MNETLVEIVRMQQLTNYGLIFIALLDFLGILICAWAYRVSRDIHRQTEQTLRETERTSYYLFNKLGPSDLK